MESQVTIEAHDLGIALLISRITHATYEFDKGTRGLGQVDLPTDPLSRMGYDITVRQVNCGEGMVLDATFPRTLELLCHAVGPDGFDKKENVVKLDMLFRKALISRQPRDRVRCRDDSTKGQTATVILS